MKLMMKTQSITKMIYPTDGHTWLRRLTFVTRGLTSSFPQQSQEPVKTHTWLLVTLNTRKHKTHTYNRVVYQKYYKNNNTWQNLYHIKINSQRIPAYDLRSFVKFCKDLLRILPGAQKTWLYPSICYLCSY